MLISASNISIGLYYTNVCLPFQVVSYIFSYLSIEECKSGSLVCKSWYNAFLDPVVIKRTRIDLTPRLHQQSVFYGLHDRRINQLHLSNLNTSKHCEQFIFLICELLSEYLLYLSITHSELTDSTLVKLLNSSPHLQTLKLSRCDNLFMTKLFTDKYQAHDTHQSTADAPLFYLNKLTTLTFHSVCYLTDAVFLNFMTLCPHITHLTVSACRITTITSTNDHLDTKFSPSQRVMLNFLSIVNSTRFHAEQITCLDLSRSCINDDVLSELCQVTELRLSELVLNNCPEITDKAITILCNCQPYLLTLDLSGNKTLTSETLAVITRKLMQLRSLQLKQLRQISGDHVKG